MSIGLFLKLIIKCEYGAITTYLHQLFPNEKKTPHQQIRYFKYPTKVFTIYYFQFNPEFILLIVLCTFEFLFSLCIVNRLLSIHLPSPRCSNKYKKKHIMKGMANIKLYLKTDDRKEKIKEKSKKFFHLACLLIIIIIIHRLCLWFCFSNCCATTFAAACFAKFTKHAAHTVADYYQRFHQTIATRIILRHYVATVDDIWRRGKK